MASCYTCRGTGEVVNAVSRYGAPSKCRNCGGTGVEPKPTEFWGEHIDYVRREELERVLRVIEEALKWQPADRAYDTAQAAIRRLREGA